jgi:hypothetical protein
MYTFVTFSYYITISSFPSISYNISVNTKGKPGKIKCLKEGKSATPTGLMSVNITVVEIAR